MLLGLSPKKPVELAEILYINIYLYSIYLFKIYIYIEVYI